MKILDMPANGPVSLTRQTIFVLIPVLDLVAFYKIKRLRMYLLIVYLGIALLAGTAYSMTVEPEYWTIDENYDPDASFEFMWSAESWAKWIPMMAITYAVAIFLVRRWSKEWNEQFP